MSPSIRLILCPGSTRRRGEFAADISLRCSPYALRTHGIALREGGVPMFSEGHLADRGFRVRPYDLTLGGRPGYEPGTPIGLGSCGLPLGGRIPPGGYPSPGCPSSAGWFCRHRVFFPCTGQLRERCGRARPKCRFPSLSAWLIPESCRRPGSLQFTGRPGPWAVAFHGLRMEPFRLGLLPDPSQDWVSSKASPFDGLPSGGRFRSEAVSGRIGLAIFIAAGLLGKQASCRASSRPFTLT